MSFHQNRSFKVFKLFQEAGGVQYTCYKSGKRDDGGSETDYTKSFKQ